MNETEIKKAKITYERTEWVLHLYKDGKWYVDRTWYIMTEYGSLIDDDILVTISDLQLEGYDVEIRYY